MKQTIRGINYDTEKAVEAANWHPVSAHFVLYRTPGGRFFLHERRIYVDQKLLPLDTAIEDRHPELLGPRQSPAARRRVARQERIRPMTRRQALQWCIRRLIPRTLHKELARTLK